MTDTYAIPAGMAADAPSRPTVRKLAIGLITLSVFAGSAARYVLSPMQELVQSDLGLGDHRIALLQGMAIALPAALASLPIGRMVDRGNRTRLLIVLALLCAAGSLLTAVAHDFATAFVARMLVGGAVVAAQSAALSLAADLTEPAARGRVITLISLGQAAGGTAAYIVAGMLLPWLPAALAGLAAMLSPIWPAAAQGTGLLASLAPWRLVQLVFAAAVLAATLLLLALREPARREAGQALHGNLGAALRALWGYRAFLLPLIGGMATVGMADAAAAIWAVPVLTRTFHQTPADFGTWMGLLNLGSGVVGAVLGGLAADLGQRKRGHAGVLLAAVTAAALSVPAALFAAMPGVGSFAALLALLLTCGACVNIAATSAIMVILPNELRGICISLVVAVIGIVALGIAPLLVSGAAQLLAGGAAPSADALNLSLTCVGVATSILATAAFVRALRVASTLHSRESQ